jgi:alkaline phosphatase isozyme conversion protein
MIDTSKIKERKAKSLFTYRLRIIAAVMVLLFAFPLSACGADDAELVIKPAQYGTYGEQIALTLATDFPCRKAFSEQEKQAGLYVKEEFEKLGYVVEEQAFSSADGTMQSVNYIVTIPGEGMMRRESEKEYVSTRKTVIVGAHYDSNVPAVEVVDMPGYNGIQDNASGIGCLLTLAKEIKNEKLAYDVVIVAFGGGSADFAGARAFAAGMTAEEILAVDVMYCIESIYAGDKLYASAGHNSLEGGKKYDKRRKLYEAYDVVYNSTLNSQNNVDLYYNMSGLNLDVNGDEILDIYREVTIEKSDYIPFDEAGIPIVFFESYDYNFSSLELMKETKNLNLQQVGGRIRGTTCDSYLLLLPELGADRLMSRINNTAYIILEAIKKGSHDSVTVSEYNNGKRLDPEIVVEETIPYNSKKS